MKEDIKNDKNKKTERIIKENANTLSYYSQNIKFYLAGFCIAIWVFLILFLLGFFSFNKTPQLLLNPKVINYIENEAFNEDFNSTEIQTEDNKNHTILSAYPILYHIWKKQIPDLNDEYYLIKKQDNNNVTINSILKDLRLPEIKTNGIKWSTLNSLSFTSPSKNYIIDIDIEGNTLYLLNNDGNKESSSNALSQKDIKKIIKSELTKLGLPLTYYWEPVFENNLSGYIDVFYPKKIIGFEVRNSENEQEGMYIRFDLEKSNILTLSNYSTQAYQLSKYPFKKSVDELLKILQRHWNIDITKKGTENSLSMKKWKFIYLQQDKYLIPALLFNGEKTKKNIILPLY